ncbi:hypothetical protein CGRA01v4_01085 [Colletotrichum graminicola]|nr:hypothetical protein CGRA01v4_01085 [Colletotrichum graminicola]
MLFVGSLGSSGIGCVMSCYCCWLRRYTLVSLFCSAGFLCRFLFWGVRGYFPASCQYRQDRKRRTRKSLGDGGLKTVTLCRDVLWRGTRFRRRRRV